MTLRYLALCIALTGAAASIACQIQPSATTEITASALVVTCAPPLALHEGRCVSKCPPSAPLLNPPPPPEVNFDTGFGATTGLTLNGGARLVDEQGKACAPTSTNPCKVRLTAAGDTFGRSSVFTTQPVPVGSFHFKVRALILDPTRSGADGFTLTLQGIGPTALGGTGGGLGFGPDPVYDNEPVRGDRIRKSIAIKLDLYDNEGEGRNSTGLFLDGVKPTSDKSIDLGPTGIDLHAGREIEIDLAHDGVELTQTIRDLVTGAEFTTSYDINVASIVGADAAYVGFTGATGALTVDLAITSFVFSRARGATCVGKCPAGSVAKDGTCVACSDDTQSDGDACVPSCGEDTPYVEEDGSCVAQCPAFIFNSACVSTCPSSTVKYGQLCLPSCPPDAPFLGPNRTCVGACPKARLGRRCLNACPPAVPYVSLSGACVKSCRTGKHHAGRCVAQCPPEAAVVSPTGECVPCNPVDLELSSSVPSGAVAYQNVRYVAKATSGAGVPTGTVAYALGAQLSARASVVGGTAETSSYWLGAGSHVITATFEPTRGYCPATASIVQTNAKGQLAVTIALVPQGFYNRLEPVPPSIVTPVHTTDVDWLCADGAPPNAVVYPCATPGSKPPGLYYWTKIFTGNADYLPVSGTIPYLMPWESNFAPRLSSASAASTANEAADPAPGSSAP